MENDVCQAIYGPVINDRYEQGHARHRPHSLDGMLITNLTSKLHLLGTAGARSKQE